MKKIVVLVSLILVVIVFSVFITKNYFQRGKVFGDIYVTMQSGDIKRVAGVDVVLYKVANPDTVFQEIINVKTQFLEASEEALKEVDKFNAETKEKTDEYEKFREPSLLELAKDRNLKAKEKYSYLKQLRAEHNSKVNGILTHLLFKKGKTDVNGHYEFSDIPYGKYIVSSNYYIFKEKIGWLHPIEVNNRENNVDLTNNNMSKGALFIYSREDK